MKPVFARISDIVENDVFMTKEIILPLFSTEFHFHEECQLVYIVESEGTRIVGDSIEPFAPGEMVLVGSNTPHVWYNNAMGATIDTKGEESSDDVYARSLALYFNASRLLKVMGQLSPSPGLERILDISTKGVVFEGEVKDRLLALFYKILNQEGLARVITFFEIMEEMANAAEYRTLASPGYVNNYLGRDRERMDRVFKFILNNFNKDILLEEVSTLAGMNKQAFCRYFKSRTSKTFVEFINQMRIEYACREMEARDCQIAALSVACGFKSLSNFNRFFKEVTGLTPREYKKKVFPGIVKEA